MSKDFSLGFASGTAFAVLVIVVLAISVPNPEPVFDVMDHPQSQEVETTAMLKDAVTVKVAITIYTKENLHTPYYEQDVKRFVRTVGMHYTYNEHETMMLKIENDAVAFLGLPCSARVTHVAISLPEGKKLGNQ